MANQRGIVRNISFALIGLAGGTLSTIVLSLLWPYIFPAIVNPEDYYGAGPDLLTIMGIVLVVIAPAALLGGVIGGRLAIEGGDRGQRMIAVLFGMVLSMPCGCGGLWFFTGF